MCLAAYYTMYGFTAAQPNRDKDVATDNTDYPILSLVENDPDLTSSERESIINYSKSDLKEINRAF